jgi:hypothetical protein
MGPPRALPVFPKVGNSQNEVAPPFPRFLGEGGPSARTTICLNARQTSSIQEQRRVHFIMFSCYRRMKLLDLVAARNTFEQELERVRRCYGCFVTGYVTNSSRPTLPPRTRQGWGNPI